MDIENSKISESLGLTSQQFGILLGIYKLESEGKTASPREINKEYSRTHGKGIQRSNFFSQMKVLQDRGLIKRGRRASYTVEFENIRNILSGKRENLQRELEEFDKISARTEEYFRKIAFESTRPVVHYMEHDELYRRIVKALKGCERVYASIDFPTIAYTYALADGINRKSYLEMIWDRCFKKERLEVNYLTPLDIDLPFNHAFRVYGDPKMAYKECSIVIEQLENQVDSHDKLDVRYLKKPHGMDVLIPEDKEPLEFFLFTRDEHKDIVGGIHMRSPETALSAKNSFMRDFEYAEQVKGEKGKAIIKNLRKEFEQKYGVCRE
ncbi:MAG: hypothetical protein KKB24_01760 [Candidatus Altiarchaeota archaeon]|nr:hypothetical protein [Candidatus Altiarchaeota archaeon]